MEKIIFFDTETCGLPKNYNISGNLNPDNWPRLVQLAYIVTDTEGNEIKERDFIVKPDGFVIPKESSDIHRITQEIALSKGVDLDTVLNEFSTDLSESVLLIAHNADYDKNVMEAEFTRRSVEYALPRVFCTMKRTTDYCQLPGNYGYKWPKMQELYFKVFNRNFEEAHNALADIRACKECFFELMERGVFKRRKQSNVKY